MLVALAAVALAGPVTRTAERVSKDERIRLAQLLHLQYV